MSAPKLAPKLRSTAINSFSGNFSVPLNSMCSRKCAPPSWVSSSSTDPASIANRISTRAPGLSLSRTK
jgi:hypothetical protein